MSCLLQGAEQGSKQMLGECGHERIETAFHSLSLYMYSRYICTVQYSNVARIFDICTKQHCLHGHDAFAIILSV